MFTKQLQVARQFFSLRGWRVFWCVFLFVVRKVRDKTARKLNRGRKRKRWRGEKAVSSPRHRPPPRPPPLFSVSTSVLHSRRSNSSFANHKKKTPKKNPPATQVSNFLATLAIWSNFLATIDVGGNLIKFLATYGNYKVL